MTHHIERMLVVFRRITDGCEIYHDVSITYRLLQAAANVGVVNTGAMEAKARTLKVLTDFPRVRDRIPQRKLSDRPTADPESGFL